MEEIKEAEPSDAVATEESEKAADSAVDSGPMLRWLGRLFAPDWPNPLKWLDPSDRYR